MVCPTYLILAVALAICHEEGNMIESRHQTHADLFVPAARVLVVVADGCHKLVKVWAPRLWWGGRMKSNGGDGPLLFPPRRWQLTSAWRSRRIAPQDKRARRRN